MGSILMALRHSPVRPQWLKPLVPGLTGSGRSRHGPHLVPKYAHIYFFSEVMGLQKGLSMSL